ncbi:MAG: type II toxin-antitoxin system RelE/ParE family toxin [Rhodospirillales bacterium]|nr:type II toxin-antitoxin system RelE/ParE family toxin [Rhodospirillales bacterium]
MSRLRFAKRALRDLAEIGRYIGRDNKREAELFVNRIKDKCWEISAAPEIGRLREGFGENIRSFPFGNYLIFYQPGKSGIVVVRVLHGARNLPAAFNSDN